MSSTLDRVPVEYLSKTLCCYHNSTAKIQVVRITNIQNWYLEHVTFPDEYFLFEAPANAELEVYQQEQSTPKLLKKLSCDRLQVEDNTEANSVSKITR
ncbi:MAG: DUF1830 domain-containing protein [Microcoleaceae cyanobacterium]